MIMGRRESVAAIAALGERRGRRGSFIIHLHQFDLGLLWGNDY
jgi:hypothetical protein